LQGAPGARVRLWRVRSETAALGTGETERLLEQLEYLDT
jgi:hypothetical protein